MSLLQEIQATVLGPNVNIAPLLLKLRFLAAKLGSHPLEEWVKFETEGYPENVDVPDYRKMGVSFTGTFSGAFGSGIKNAPIPPYLIEKFAGKDWSNFELRQSIAAVDELIASAKGGGILHLNFANLILLIQGKIYPGYACNEVIGVMSVAQLREIQNVVKSKILELTISLEKSVPEAAKIAIGEGQSGTIGASSQKIDQIFHQTIYGNMTNLTNSGSIGSVNIGIVQNDKNSLAAYLTDAGISGNDAAEFADIASSEKPESATEPFGQKAKAWITKNIGKAVDGTWKVGIGVATETLKQAALKYYGLDAS